MLGSVKPFGDSQRLAADTYEITGDQNGAIQAVLRVITLSYKISGQVPEFTPETTVLGSLWQNTIQNALQSKKVDVSQVYQQLQPIPAGESQAIAKIVDSLPQAVKDDLFVESYRCASCNARYSSVSVRSSLRGAGNCRQCGCSALEVTRASKLLLVSEAALPCRFSSDGRQYALMAAFSAKQQAISALFSDFLSEGQHNFCISVNPAIQRSEQIADMTFLRPEAALQWMGGSNRRCAGVAGELGLYAYYNMQYCRDGAAAHKISQFYEDMPQKSFDSQETISNSLSQGQIVPAADSVFERNEPVVSRRFVSDLLISPWMVALGVLVLLLLVVNIVLLSVLQHMKNTTIVLNNLDIANEMTVQYNQTANLKQALPSSFNLLAKSAYIPSLSADNANLPAISVDCTYEDAIDLSTVDLSKAEIVPSILNVGTLKVDNFTFKGQMTLQPNINVSELNIENLSASFAKAENFIGQRDMTVNDSLVATQLIQASNVNAPTILATDIYAGAESTFSSFRAENVELNNVETQAPIECNYSVDISGNAQFYAPTLNNLSSIHFSGELSKCTINNEQVAYNVEIPQNIIFNATVGMTNATSALDTAITNSSIGSLTCNNAKCNVSVNELQLDENVTVSQKINIQNLASSEVILKDVQSENITVGSTQINSAGVTTNGLADLNGAQFSEGKINFMAQTGNVILPALIATDVNLVAEHIRDSQAVQDLVILTNDINYNELTVGTLNILTSLGGNYCRVNQELTTDTLTVNTIICPVIEEELETGQQCDALEDSGVEGVCNILNNGELTIPRMFCGELCNVET